jgi:hypothetical protein
VPPAWAERDSSPLDRTRHIDRRSHPRRSCPNGRHRDSVAPHQAGVLLLPRQVFGNPCPSRAALGAALDRPDSGRGGRDGLPRWPGAALESPVESGAVPPHDTMVSSTRGPGHTRDRGRTTPGISNTYARGRGRVAPPTAGREVDSRHRRPHDLHRDQAAPPAGRSGCTRTARLISPQPHPTPPLTPVCGERHFAADPGCRQHHRRRRSSSPRPGRWRMRTTSRMASYNLDMGPA